MPLDEKSKRNHPPTSVELLPIDSIDTAVLCRWQNDSDLRKLTMGFRFPVQERAVQDWLSGLSKKNGNDSAYFSVFFEDKAVGMCSVNDINWVHRNCFIGLYLAERNFMKRGLGASTLRHLLEFCFLGINMHRVALRVHSKNQSAIELYKKFDFSDEGVEEQAYFLNGKYVDVVRMSLLSNRYSGQE